ncbi:hypothetical protein KC332_g10924 [Hortaea werneckii]|uniref:Uncharacterized protein n=2 Tax=Hortaea werneckii TaxID=91943 RepID=A0A3M7GDI0_HORWE|nr:hypothetical protein KC350_g10267 [Hortaea werneckii]OTA25233.1 hypothetical protein BTJ68_11766 [Hortaea werneckii EXF-2000]KAI6820766.1 hypothetical protein KC358_g9328 [Hortaea werneckii]KAI6922364.1 hypothetical protein KC348_g9809 [Hortaea werneckii]KAI6930929.1 hypothetical protein KC341_g9912 [Hortaea werneckii]
MIVPRHYVLSSSPPKTSNNSNHTRHEKVSRRTGNQTSTPPPLSPSQLSPRAAVQPSTGRPPPPTDHPTSPQSEPMRPTSKPVPVPTASPRNQPATANNMHTTMPARSRNISGKGKKKTRDAHDPDAMSPSVAALLAMTAIPPPRPNQFRRKSREQRRISIDQLVNEWKKDDAWRTSSLSSSPGLSVLLEDACDSSEEPSFSPEGSATENGMLQSRSTSSDSVPSLDADDRSMSSFGSPATPESFRNPKSPHSHKRERALSQVLTEDTTLNHPLGPTPLPSDDDNDRNNTLLSAPKTNVPARKSRSSFKSNLTTSLRALRKSLPSFNLNNATVPTQRNPSTSAFSDQMLWSHPALFPRFSSEIRPPQIEGGGLPTSAQRRYLNPSSASFQGPSPPSSPIKAQSQSQSVRPLTFEEQEAPFQQALHAPYLAEAAEVGEALPSIQMQTYTRYGAGGNNRRGKSTPAARRNTGGAIGVPSQPDAASEAGRALSGESTGGNGDAGLGGGSGIFRHREPRENSNFLRVVVLEMNMRREGKLESGRARIWLPPRQQQQYSLSSRSSFASPYSFAEDEEDEERFEQRQEKVPRRWRAISAY